MGGQDGEDIGLEASDEDLQGEDGEAGDERDAAGEVIEEVVVEEEPGAADDEDADDEVAGQQVGEEPQTQGERAGDEVREELEGDDEDEERLGDAGRHRHLLEIAERAVLLDADGVVEDPRRDGERPDEADLREGREHEESELAEEVVDEDEAEERHEIGHILMEIVADRLTGDTVTDKVVKRLGDELALRRNDLEATGGPEPEADDDERAENRLENVVGEPDISPLGLRSAGIAPRLAREKRPGVEVGEPEDGGVALQREGTNASYHAAPPFG